MGSIIANISGPASVENGGNRKVKKQTEESQIKRSIRELLRWNKIFYYNAFGGPLSQKGISDLICCYKGRFVAIEVKKKAGKLSPDQETFLQHVNESGGLGFVARSVEDVIHALGLKVNISG